MEDVFGSGSPIVWRHLQRHLWAGAGPAGPLGTIEEGHRFTAIDATGAVLARCRSLDAAKAALLGRSRSG